MNTRLLPEPGMSPEAEAVDDSVDDMVDDMVEMLLEVDEPKLDVGDVAGDPAR